jgi:hypothetical protein
MQMQQSPSLPPFQQSQQLQQLQQSQQSWGAPAQPQRRSAVGPALLWGIVFALPLFILQLIPLVFPRLYAALGARDARASVLLLILGALGLVCSFFAALLAARASGRLWPGLFAGVLARLLPGLLGLFEVWANWHNVLARLDRPALQAAARQAIGRSVFDLLVSLLLCLAVAVLGALVGRRRNPAPAQPSQSFQMNPVYVPATNAATRMATPGGFTALPPTPTPNGWQFTPYEPSGQSSPYSQYGQNGQWQFGAQGQPAQSGYYSPPSNDPPTRMATGDTPTQLTPSEETSLPLPYASMDQPQPPRR